MKLETLPDPTPRPIASNARANQLARNADVTTPLTPAVAAAATGLPIVDAPLPPPAPACVPSTQVDIDGFIWTIYANTTSETIDHIIKVGKALAKRGYHAPVTSAPAQPIAPIAEPDDLPEGWKLCQKHHAPMRPRNKQNANWHSHNVGTKDLPLWCKGYRGADSPGYEVE